MDGDDYHDELDDRIAALQAEQAAAAAPEPEPEAIEAQADEAQPETQEASTEATEPADDDDLLRPDKRLERMAFEKREAVRNAKRLEAEIARLQGTRTETTDEAVQRQALIMAQDIAKQNAFNEKCNTIGKALDKEYGSASEIVRAFADSFPDQGGIPAPILETVIEAGDGQEHKIIHYLSKNLDVAEEIMKKTPAQQGVAIAKIAAKLSQPVVSKAPAPIPRVAGSSGSTVEVVQKDFEKMTTAERIAFFDKEDFKERQRKFMH